MALSVLFISNYGSVQETLPPRVSGPSRLVSVTPADRVNRDFPRQGLPIVLRTVRPSQLVRVIPADITVPVNISAIRSKAIPSPLRVDPSKVIFPTFLWPTTVTFPMLLFLTPLENNAIPFPALQSAPQLVGQTLLTGYTPPVLTPPEVEVGIISAIRQLRDEPIAVSRLVGDYLTLPLPTIEVEISVISAVREAPKEPVSVSRLVGEVYPLMLPTLEFDISIISALRETAQVPISVSKLIGDLLPITPPGPEFELPAVLSNAITAGWNQIPLPNPSRLAGGLLLPVQNPQTRLLVELRPLRLKHRSGGEHPLFPLVAGQSQSIIWLFPAPPPDLCALGIGIVPIYYTSPGPNVVPVETLTPGVLPWGWANWTDVMPVCVQPPGPNVVPVYEAPTTVPRVKIRAARPEM